LADLIDKSRYNNKEGFSKLDFPHILPEDLKVRQRSHIMAHHCKNVFFILTLFIRLVIIAGDVPVTNKQADQLSVGTSCVFMQSALSENPDFFRSVTQPYLFSPATALFKVLYYAVPGDEEGWWKLRYKYPWNMVLGTHVFVSSLFKSKLAGADPLLIDVGLNMGQETVIVSSLGGLTLSFEPLPKAWKRTLFNLRLNCLDSNRTRVLNYGVGNSAVNISVSQDVFTPGSTNSPSGNAHAVQVEISTLDEQFYNSNQVFRKRPLLLKMDTEGHEYEGIEGASKLLGEFPPFFIMIEIITNKQHTVKDFHEILVPHGYSPAFVLGVNDEIVGAPNDEGYFKRYWERPFKSFKHEHIGSMDVIFEHKDATRLRTNYNNEMYIF